MTDTPLTHVPVLLAEAIDALATDPAGVYIDATFGRGGHSRALLARLGPQGRLFAIDRDPQAIRAAAAIGDPRFAIAQAEFGQLAAACSRAGITRVHGVLLDLGVSSPQLDDPQRGFSFRHDGPLDMRMNPDSGPTAAQWLAQATENEITEVIREYGEERFARSIAKALVAARTVERIDTTGQLARIVGGAVRTREPGQDPATRTFQALRIHINSELAQLPLALEQATALLRAGGRLAVISFHSLEDRIVKHFMRDAAHPEAKLARLPIATVDLPRPRLRVIGRPVRPSEQEVRANPRSRSAMLRVAQKVE